MEDIINDVGQWQAEGKLVAVATVIQTWGSSPRQAGAKMGISPGNLICGSVSGGCVEGTVYETGLKMLADGVPQLLHFGVADETAWEVGLACGGSIELFVEQLDEAMFAFAQQKLADGLAYGVGTIVRGNAGILGRKIFMGDDHQSHGNLGEWQKAGEKAVGTALNAGKSCRVQLDSETELFIEIHRPAPTLIIVGGAHIAIHLAAFAKELGYQTVLIDPRRAFGNKERFPHVDHLLQLWPPKAFEQLSLTPDCAIAMLTHDPKIDDPALKIALNSPAFYVGALGSDKTQLKRRKRLAKEGLTVEQISRIHGPIGLDLGGRTPPEIGLAVMAEIVMARRKAMGE